MDTFIDLIKQHRSIRRFKDQPLDDGVLEQILTAGQSASTSSYIQATSIVRVSDAQIRSQFVELSGGQKYIANASEFLVFCADFCRSKQRIEQLGHTDTDFSWTEQFLSASVDVALFAQNTVLAAESLGLGCCYIGGIRNNPEKVTELLALPELVYPVFGLCIGVPDQDPEPKPRLPINAVLHEGYYQNTPEKNREIDIYDTHVKQYYQRRTNGKLSHSWSEQMLTQSSTQTRPFIKEFLNKQGFMKK